MTETERQRERERERERERSPLLPVSSTSKAVVSGTVRWRTHRYWSDSTSVTDRLNNCVLLNTSSCTYVTLGRLWIWGPWFCGTVVVVVSIVVVVIIVILIVMIIIITFITITIKTRLVSLWVKRSCVCV